LNSPESRIREYLNFIYGEETSAQVYSFLTKRLDEYQKLRQAGGIDSSSQNAKLSQADSVLITYGDQFQEAGQLPLQTLAEFLTERIKRRYQHFAYPAVLSVFFG
jgi:cyanophycinase-like exopeptidase